MPKSRYISANALKGRWVIAHRGNSGRYPENTIVAFQSAVDVGADFIELDVHLSADGEIVVMHDGELGRTCTGEGNIADLEWSYLAQQDAGAWMGDEFTGEHIPLLSQVFSDIPLPVMVEIKPEGEEIVRRTCEVVRNANAQDRVVIASFSDANIQWAEQFMPECERLALRAGSMDRMDSAHIGAPHLPDANVTLASTLHAHGRALWVWTVDEPQDIDDVIALGADGIISNWPERVLEALG
jgi:glycerophosphoryl diester phosphodiesterase